MPIDTEEVFVRLITRGDSDGLVCAVLLSTVEKINKILFVHPKDMQDGKVDVGPADIIANLPFNPNCGIWFDHHISEEERVSVKAEFKGSYGLAPSAARLIYNYYNHPKLKRFEALVAETDKMDSAQLRIEDVIAPKGYMLLFFTIDPRTGLGRFQEYFLKLVEYLKIFTIEEILEKPEVKERVEKMLAEQEAFQDLLLKYTRLEENVIFTDLRGLEEVPAGNRFLIYTLFPEGNVSVRVFHGKDRKNVVVAVAHSIFNRTSRTNIGHLLGEYGGGGHRGAGTVQFPIDEAEFKTEEIIQRLKQDG